MSSLLQNGPHVSKISAVIGRVHVRKKEVALSSSRKGWGRRKGVPGRQGNGQRARVCEQPPIHAPKKEFLGPLCLSSSGTALRCMHRDLQVKSRLPKGSHGAERESESSSVKSEKSPRESRALRSHVCSWQVTCRTPS